ncbi:MULTISPECIES: DUF3885 domain-containing protein [unclassified Paludibacterium]|uniref:DUF3885 domain-containing protein n=1 Tax=unclassified Paludibacterium TaxID=2618429 RepID=UPI001C05CFB2|nr:DUF3885 domain-containing protein [Paludibacterium sp. B53371]BEV73735.1 DUF3885 domain-containing protein [Paludibacterium sp. THUN1379]
MSLKDQIEKTFGHEACSDGLFYRFPGGLRFELSESGTSMEMVLGALWKAKAIFEFTFTPSNEVLVCLRRFMGESPYSLRSALRELEIADISIPANREYWLESIAPKDRFDENTEEWYAYLAFELPVAKLEPLIWCAVATDFPQLHPNPHCSVYVIDIKQRLLAHPYDDRGMDIIGPNTQRLSELYAQFNSMLLDYDRSTMDKSFKTTNNQKHENS